MSGSGDAGSLRLFVAVELPASLRDVLARTIDELRRAGAGDGVRWVRPDGIHITLKFLGGTPPGRVPAITAALREHLRGTPSFTLQPEGIGTFHGGRHVVGQREWQREPRHHNIRVLWVGVAGDTAALAGLARRVEDALAPLGFPGEKRPFTAHLTLGRVKDDASRDERERLFAALEPYMAKGVRTGNFRPELAPAFPPFAVRGVSLMQSTLQRGGAVYRALETFPLA